MRNFTRLAEGAASFKVASDFSMIMGQQVRPGELQEIVLLLLCFVAIVIERGMHKQMTKSDEIANVAWKEKSLGN